jgi:uncharacterized membrane protein YeaQ/YmgE (transglycosylase-associated protein family)
MLFGVVGWIVAGVIVGFIVSKSVNLRGDSPTFGIGLAGVGAVVGGWLYSWISGSPVVAFNAWSLVLAGAGAAVVLVIWHVIRSRSPHEQPTVRRSY